MANNVLAEVFAEMRRARAKHGDLYMGNLPDAPVETYDSVLSSAMSVGEDAHDLLESEDADTNRFYVLMEEVGELAEALYGERPHDAREELVQVAAMALAWLGVEPDTGSDHE